MIRGSEKEKRSRRNCTHGGEKGKIKVAAFLRAGDERNRAPTKRSKACERKEKEGLKC